MTYFTNRLGCTLLVRACLIVCGAAAIASPAALYAQDSVPPLERGVRVGITYTPGLRPGMLVLWGARNETLDSVRAILNRDLDFSDRFEMITLPSGDTAALELLNQDTATDAQSADEAGAGGQSEFPPNYSLYAALGADYAVNVFVTPDSAVEVTVDDVRGEARRREILLPVLRLDDPHFRMAVHRASDEIVRAAAGTPGIAATQLLFVRRGRVYRIDSDGAAVEALTPEGVHAMSPAWSPDARRLAYMDFDNGTLYVQDVSGDAARAVPPTTRYKNFTPAFAPDGRSLAFARATDDGTHVYLYDLADDCCLQRLTVGRFSDNLSPTFSPNGQRIAFVSTRAGQPQVYVMATDGTGQELFAPFDYGVTGNSYAPTWSPDGLNVAFHRHVEFLPQVFVMDVASRSVRQLTSFGRNEDATWAPDGRHLAFVSNRTRSRQIWVIDVDTGRIRQLTRLGGPGLPAWSPRIPEPTTP